MAVGPGARNEAGTHIPMAVQVGDKVLLPEFGGAKVKHMIIIETSCIDILILKMLVKIFVLQLEILFRGEGSIRIKSCHVIKYRLVGSN